MRWLALAAAIGLTAAACGDGETRTAFTTPLDEALLQEAFDDWADDAPGGGVAAVRSGRTGEVLLLAAGTEPDGTPLEPDSLVRVGSISKTIIATLVLDLVDEGLVDLEQPISVYLPDTPLGAEVTVRQLLSHSSGIANYTDSPAFLAGILGDTGRRVTPEDVVSFVGDEDQLFEPGSDFSYSNTNYILLGQLIETVGGSSINDALDDVIADPLGLDSMHFDDGSLDVVDGYSQSLVPGTTPYTSVATSAWAAGALVTTADDLQHYLHALVAGRIIPEEHVAAMWPTSDNDDYGLGLRKGEQFAVGHPGSIFGFNSLMQHDPGTGDLMVVVVNNEERRASIASQALVDAAEG